jgi:uncharacterized Zn-finger protein
VSCAFQVFYERREVEARRIKQHDVHVIALGVDLDDPGAESVHGADHRLLCQGKGPVADHAFSIFGGEDNMSVKR